MSKILSSYERRRNGAGPDQCDRRFRMLIATPFIQCCGDRSNPAKTPLRAGSKKPLPTSHTALPRFIDEVYNRVVTTQRWALSAHNRSMIVTPPMVKSVA
jgi:hypothetical protein